MPGNRRHIPVDQKKLVVIMASNKKPKEIKEIADATGISVRTVQRILEKWRTTGNCVKIPLELGRPRILTALDVDVSLFPPSGFADLPYASFWKASYYEHPIYIRSSCSARSS
jgi:hypothetical protein